MARYIFSDELLVARGCHNTSVLSVVSALYEGCWHKLARSKEHLDELKNRVGHWIHFHRKPPYVFGKKFDAKRNRFTFHVEGIEALPVEWCLIAGDVLTNLRASLDYLAYDLVGRGAMPHRRDEMRTQFPIARKKGDFKGFINGRMPGISPKQWTIIEAYQPYKWGGARNRHPFALLDTLVNWDKHKQLQLIAVYNTLNFRANVVSVSDFAIHRVEAGRVFGKRRNRIPPFELGTRVAHVIGETTGPDPNVDMDFQGAVSIAFKDARALFPDALEGMGQAIARLFREIEPTL